MLRDLTNKKVDLQAATAAIAALQAKSWDVNPYTVADEIKVQHSAIYRNSEIMELIAEARTKAGLAGYEGSEQLIKASSPSAESAEADQSVAELKAHLDKVEQENRELAELQQDAWQRGYKAGWDEASIYLAADAPPPAQIAPETSEVAESDWTETEGPEMYLESSESPESSESLESGNESYAEPQVESYSESLSYSVPPDEIQEESAYTTNSFADSFPTDAAEDASTQEEYYPEGSEPGQYSFLDEQVPVDDDTSTQDAEVDEHISTEELDNLLKQHRQKADPESVQAAKSRGLAASKFARPQDQNRGFVLRSVPPDIRKSCLVLGIRPEDMSRQAINDAWKREITKPGTHPDQGGDSEIAVYLNTAKDVLLRWWETQEPKLGKQFGNQAKAGTGPATDPIDATFETDTDETETGM